MTPSAVMSELPKRREEGANPWAGEGKAHDICKLYNSRQTHFPTALILLNFAKQLFKIVYTMGGGSLSHNHPLRTHPLQLLCILDMEASLTYNLLP